MNDLHELCQIHQEAQWPDSLGGSEGELMMLDTVIVGCITYYVEENELDTQRVGILEDSLSELDQLLPDIPDEATAYFLRLQQLGFLILNETPKGQA